MSFNKLFISFLIKYYRIVINALHIKNVLKLRETSHWIQETTVCSQVSSVWIKVTSVRQQVSSVWIKVTSVMKKETSHLLRETSLFIKETSLWIKVNIHLLIECSPLTKVKSPITNVHFFVINDTFS